MKNPESRGRVYNVCGNEVHKMQYYTDILINESGFEYNEIKQEIYPPYYRQIDIQVQIGDNKELKELTDWHTTIPIDKTMKDLLNYWRKKLSLTA
jgi:nucleoside-diphosphate-sugar epimerase